MLSLESLFSPSKVSPRETRLSFVMDGPHFSCKLPPPPTATLLKFLPPLHLELCACWLRWEREAKTSPAVCTDLEPPAPDTGGLAWYLSTPGVSSGPGVPGSWLALLPGTTEGGEGQNRRREDVPVIGKLHVGGGKARLVGTPLARPALELGSGERWREGPGLTGSLCHGAE